MAQLTPEARARLDAFKDVTVKHAHLQAVDDQLSLWVEEHTDATHVLLCGPGGVGKSKALIRALVKAVFADEGHRRGLGDGSHSVDEQLEWLKSLSNRTHVLHVLAGPCLIRVSQYEWATRSSWSRYSFCTLSRCRQRRTHLATC